jgi:hypothetical protein
MARGETDVPILFSWSQVASTGRTPLISPPAAGGEPARTRDSAKAQGRNENNIRRLMRGRRE